MKADHVPDKSSPPQKPENPRSQALPEPGKDSHKEAQLEPRRTISPHPVEQKEIVAGTAQPPKDKNRVSAITDRASSPSLMEALRDKMNSPIISVQTLMQGMKEVATSSIQTISEQYSAEDKDSHSASKISGDADLTENAQKQAGLLELLKKRNQSSVQVGLMDQLKKRNVSSVQIGVVNSGGDIFASSTLKAEGLNDPSLEGDQELNPPAEEERELGDQYFDEGE